MDYIDYYQKLGLAKDALAEDIRKAYRKLARKYHPDTNSGNKDAEKKFKEINEANTVLSDPIKRKKYDTYGKDWEHADAFEAARNQSGRNSRNGQGRGFTQRNAKSKTGTDQEYFSDFFQSMFFEEEDFLGNQPLRNGRRTSAPSRGVDFKSILQLELKDILTEQPHVLDVNGRKIRIKIPAGVENGQTVKIQGQGGEQVSGGPKGDLYIQFDIVTHPIFNRSGADLHATKIIDLYTAVLGGETNVPTLNGSVNVKVKPGTQHGLKVRLKGQGMPVYKSDRVGDLIVTYQIQIPNDLSSKELDLFNQLKDLRKNNI